MSWYLNFSAILSATPLISFFSKSSSLILGKGRVIELESIDVSAPKLISISFLLDIALKVEDIAFLKSLI